MTNYSPKARHWLIAVLTFLLLFLAGGTSVAGNEKVGICHATNSASNPYVYIEVSEAAAQAHLDDTHPSHHGVTLEDEDYLADGPADCGDIVTSPTPAPSSTETPSPTVAPSPSADPTVSPTPSASVAPSPSPTESTSAPTLTEGGSGTEAAPLPDTAMDR